MKSQEFRLLPKILIATLLFVFFLVFPKNLLATSGCCSWHGGQSYCDYSTGRWVCADGTYSPSCTCGGGSYTTYPSIPTCPLFSSYNSLTEKCECYSGYIASGSQCISQTQACQNELGYSSRYDSLSGTCECSYGYVIGSSGTCISGSSFCWNKYGYSSTYDSLSKSCECNYGYRFNLSGTKCISDNEACQEQFGYNSKATFTGDKCECKSGYVWEGNSCVWDTSAYTYSSFATTPTNTPTIKPTQKPTATKTPITIPTSTPSQSPEVKAASTEVTPTASPSPKSSSSGGGILGWIILGGLIAGLTRIFGKKKNKEVNPPQV